MRLDLSIVNRHSPYTVFQEEHAYYFWTAYDILYMVTFEEDAFGGNDVFWFNLANLSRKNSPGDRKVQDTIVCVIEEFFRMNRDVLLYLCDTANDQQAMRARLFSRWFNSYEAKQKYILRSDIVEAEGQTDYVALIVSRENPYAEQIVQLFEAEIKIFKENKI